VSEELMQYGASTPCVYLDLKGAQTKQLDGVEAGTGVKVVLVGKVKSVTERADGERYTGSLEVEYSRLTIIPESNEFGDLVEDDDD
jgi:hypothetical protein